VDEDAIEAWSSFISAAKSSASSKLGTFPRVISSSSEPRLLVRADETEAMEPPRCDPMVEGAKRPVELVVAYGAFMKEDELAPFIPPPTKKLPPPLIIPCAK
jgi:hypothetical protein